MRPLHSSQDIFNRNIYIFKNSRIEFLVFRPIDIWRALIETLAFLNDQLCKHNDIIHWHHHSHLGLVIFLSTSRDHPFSTYALKGVIGEGDRPSHTNCTKYEHKASLLICQNSYLCYYKMKSLQSNHVHVFLPPHQTCTFFWNWNISKMKQGNKKLKDNLLCYFKCSFK